MDWQGQAVNIIYIDFIKAIDNVPHGRLVRMVESRYPGTAGHWILNRLGGMGVKCLFF